MAGNFWGRKLLWISQICGYSRKFSLQNLGGMTSVGMTKASNPRKFSLRKLYFTKVFSLESFPLYGNFHCQWWQEMTCVCLYYKQPKSGWWTVYKATGSMCVHIQNELFVHWNWNWKCPLNLLVYMALEMFYKMPAHHEWGVERVKLFL